MGSGQYISDDQSRLRLAVVMGLSTLIFSFLPAVPFLFGGSRTGDGIAALLITLAVGVLIAELRPGSRAPSYRLTFGVLLVGVLLGVVWGVFAPGS
jgi:VIT1/CCC1 family predicted Fe2+/Mn2+ transporter